MANCIGFGSNGATIMVGKNTGVATLLKKVHSFLAFIHCVANKTNLVALEASKNESCKKNSADVDSMLNLLFALFKKSSKRKEAL